MSEPLSQLAVDENPQGLESAEIVVGIPSFNEEDTIRHVVQVIDGGLRRDFAGRSAAIISADNASTDATRRVFLETETETPKIYLSTPDGVRGKGNNLFNLFAKSKELGAEAFELANTILVLRGGDVQQLAPPRELVRTPANDYVQRLVTLSRIGPQ